MPNGFHSHYCPTCKANKECALITHCRRGPQADCADCVYDKLLKEKLMPEETPTQGMIDIDDDLTNTKVVLWEMIAAHQASDKKSRERSLLITKLQEARMWADEAQAQS